jgi:transposase
MREDGQSLKEIAKELGTSVATVKGWLDTGKKGE